MNFGPVPAFCVENEGNASFLTVPNAEEAASTSVEEG